MFSSRTLTSLAFFVSLLFSPLSLWASQAAADSPSPAPKKASKQTQSGLYISAKQTYDLQQKPEGRKVVLVDVRDPVEIMFTGYTDAADIHVPWKVVDPTTFDEKRKKYQASTNPDFTSEVLDQLESLGADKDSHIIFMCRSGSTRSAPAADALYKQGYKNVYSMIDGFEGGKAKEGDHAGARVVNGWKNSGLPWGWKLNSEKMYLVLR